MGKNEECVLCYLALDDEQEVIFETETCLYVQKKSVQRTLEGSGLIIPKAHKETVFDLSKTEWQETYELLQKVKKYVEQHFNPDGYNIGWNVASTGGQSLSHVHLHIIPRYKDETYAGKGIRYWIKQPENKRKKDQNRD